MIPAQESPAMPNATPHDVAEPLPELDALDDVLDIPAAPRQHPDGKWSLPLSARMRASGVTLADIGSPLYLDPNGGLTTMPRHASRGVAVVGPIGVLVGVEASGLALVQLAGDVDVRMGRNGPECAARVGLHAERPAFYRFTSTGPGLSIPT
jgi:hypothetical protein